MYIRKAAEGDLPRMMEIYAAARRFMAAHGNPNQWGPTNWPPEERIRADIAEGNTVSHLTYIGDATVGKYCNFGCGTVTCNYDGEGKFHTTIGDYAFIGCNTNLVAPVTIGDHAFTAAGSTIGHDVPAGALGIERAKQAEIDGWGERKLEKYIAKKQKLEAEKKGK